MHTWRDIFIEIYAYVLHIQNFKPFEKNLTFESQSKVNLNFSLKNFTIIW